MVKKTFLNNTYACGWIGGLFSQYLIEIIASILTGGVTGLGGTIITFFASAGTGIISTWITLFAATGTGFITTLISIIVTVYSTCSSMVEELFDIISGIFG